jgi:hypothetical protein
MFLNLILILFLPTRLASLQAPWAAEVLAKMNTLDSKLLQGWSDLLTFASQPGTTREDVHKRELELLR